MESLQKWALARAWEEPDISIDSMARVWEESDISIDRMAYDEYAFCEFKPARRRVSAMCLRFWNRDFSANN